MAISFQALGEKYVSFLAASGVLEGQVCKLTANQTVGSADSGEAFCGVTGKVRGGCAAVQMAGYVELPYSGTAPALGYAALVADGDGGVKTAGQGETGRSCLIVSVDTTDMVVGLFL